MSRHRTVTGQLELPKNWKWVPLGEILSKIIGGGTPSKSNPSYWQGKIPWLTIKDMRTRRPIDSIDHISEVAIKESSTNIIPADTVIIATRVGLGKVIRVPYDSTINQDLKALIPKAGIDKSYLEYWIVSIADYLESIGSGTTVKGIRLETLKEIPFPLAPPEDQKRIVAEIEKQFSRLDEAVASLKRIQVNLKRYKAAVLKAAVEGKLTEQWRKDHPNAEPADQLLKRILAERHAKWEAEEQAKMKAKGINPKDDSWKKKYKEPAGPDTANLPELPDGWVWVKSDQLFSFVTSGSRGWACYYSETGPIFLRMGNLDHETISLDLSDIQRVQPPEGAEGSRTRVVAGDILISITADVGMIGMVPDGFEVAYINQHVSLARPLTIVNSTYLAWFLACKTGQDQFKELQRGATKVGLGLDDIRTVNAPLPPSKEQKAILEEIDRRLSVTQELETTIETNLKRAERLRQTILQRAFSGGLV